MGSKLSHQSRVHASLALLLTVFLGMGCEPEPPPPPRTTISPQDYDPTADIPEEYHFLYTGGIGYDEFESLWDRLPYTRIEMERTECFGNCPSYVVTFHANGKATYSGRKYSDRVGKFDGEIQIRDYGQICWLLDRFKILDGPRDYASSWTDDSTAIIRITPRGANEPIVISDYGGQGPVELWSFFNVMDAVANRVEWTPHPHNSGD